MRKLLTIALCMIAVILAIYTIGFVPDFRFVNPIMINVYLSGNRHTTSRRVRLIDTGHPTTDVYAIFTFDSSEPAAIALTVEIEE